MAMIVMMMMVVMISKIAAPFGSDFGGCGGAGSGDGRAGCGGGADGFAAEFGFCPLWRVGL
jgi:hypothetical protein